VVELHDLASAVSRSVSLPRGAQAGEARDLTSRFHSLQAKTALAAQSAGPRTQLSEALVGYETIATQLASKQAALSAAGVRELTRTDAQWRAALRSIGDASNQNLLAMVPPLLAPLAASAAAPTTPRGLPCAPQHGKSRPSTPCAKSK
jgi:hypothetical protein